MKLYRKPRGLLYLVCPDPLTAWVYDPATGHASPDFHPADLGRSLREWLPVAADEPIPDGLAARLVLPYRPRGG